MGWCLLCNMKSIFLLSAVMLLTACQVDSITPEQDDYVFRQPANFPEPAYTFDNNPLSKEGFELGRALFYDPILSADSTISCSNCHQQARSFSDPVHRLSVGVNDAIGIRNAPAIQNMAFQQHFFWDGGVNHLDFAPIAAITSDVEMAETVANVVEKLKRNTFYNQKFSEAFGSGEINSQRMLFALSQFMNLMVSANSRYDRFIRNEGEVLTLEEQAGLALFQTHCSNCHATDLFTDGSFRNNGLNTTFEVDSGRQRITEHAEDRGKFKVPSLRNAELTFPYMHDGRFRTLEQVMDHYRFSLKESPTLDPLFKNNTRPGIVLTDDEANKIIAFVKTLTDNDFIKDKKFANPF